MIYGLYYIGLVLGVMLLWLFISYDVRQSFDLDCDIL